MRSYPSGWSKTLARLGFRRKLRRKPKGFSGRSSSFESLESRQLLFAGTFNIVATSFQVTPGAVGSEDHATSFQVGITATGSSA